MGNMDSNNSSNNGNNNDDKNNIDRQKLIKVFEDYSKEVKSDIEEMVENTTAIKGEKFTELALLLSSLGRIYMLAKEFDINKEYSDKYVLKLYRNCISIIGRMSSLTDNEKLEAYDLAQQIIEKSIVKEEVLIKLIDKI